MINEQNDEKIVNDDESQPEVVEQGYVIKTKKDVTSQKEAMQSPAPPDDRAVDGLLEGQILVKSEKTGENEPFNDLPLPTVLDADQELDKRWYSIPRKAQQILILRETGFTCEDIAKLCKCAPTLVSYYVKTYDPQRVLRLSTQAQKAILAHRFSKLANQAIQNVTPEKLQASSAAQLTTIAAIAADKLNAFAPSPSVTSADSDALEVRLSVMFKRGDTTDCG